jgi:hypothetical protein
MAGGRQPTSMLASTVVFSGGIALLYAYGGLRRRPAGHVHVYVRDVRGRQARRRPRARIRRRRPPADPQG